MELDISFDNEDFPMQDAWPLDARDVETICTHVLSAEGVTRPCAVSISLVSDEEIQALNLEWRGKDRPTDVISLECERPDDPDLAPDEICELGDIVCAPVYIERQAQQFGSSFKAEATLLVVHGLLHLLGYDHIEDAEAEVMEAKEDVLLAQLLPKEDLGHVLTTRHREGIDE